MADFSARESCRNGSFRGRRDMPRIFAHHAGGVAWKRRLDFLKPGLDLFLREFHGQRPFGDIEDNHVAVLHGADRATL